MKMPEPSTTIAGDQTTVQARFAGALLDPDAEIPAGAGKAGKPDARRFGVYRNNVAVSLVEALASAYPAIAAILGNDFARVARTFIDRHPPATPVMAEFGRGFADFLAGFGPLRHAPFLGDLARVERLWLDAYHAADQSALGAGGLSAIAPDQLADIILFPHPAAALLTSAHPVFDLFGARETWPPAADIDLEASQAILITRPQLEVLVFAIDAANAEFFEALFSGKTLGDSIGAAASKDEDFDAASAIALMLNSGAFAGTSRIELQGRDRWTSQEH
jgi:hypothetical protein